MYGEYDNDFRRVMTNQQEMLKNQRELLRLFNELAKKVERVAEDVKQLRNNLGPQTLDKPILPSPGKNS